MFQSFNPTKAENLFVFIGLFGFFWHFWIFITNVRKETFFYKSLMSFDFLILEVLGSFLACAAP